MNMKKYHLFITIFFSLSILGYAGTDDAIPKAEVLDLSPMLYSNYIGLSYTSLKLINKNNLASFTGKGVSIKVGHRLNRFIAFEGRYSKSTKVKYSKGKSILTKDDNNYPTIFTNIGFYVKPSLPIKKLSIYSLFGYGRVELTNIPKGDVNRAESSLQLGGGVEYFLPNHSSLFVDYTSIYQGQGFDYLGTSDQHKADMFSVGVNYHF